MVFVGSHITRTWPPVALGCSPPGDGLAHLVAGDVGINGLGCSQECWTMTELLTHRVYLCGPINGCTDDEANGWRTTAISLLYANALTPVDPMARDYRGREHEPWVSKAIVEADTYDISTCHTLLMMFERPSVGSSMEVLLARQMGLDVIVTDRSDRELSPWLVHHATHVVHTLGEAVETIKASQGPG